MKKLSLIIFIVLIILPLLALAEEDKEKHYLNRANSLFKIKKYNEALANYKLARSI